MNKETKETIKNLRNNSLVKSGSYELIGDSDITYAEIYILFKFIGYLQQENQQLKIQISAREEKYKKLEDNWNKLKEFLELRLHENCNLSMYGVVQIRQEIKKAILKMQKLERGVSDVED